MDFASKFAFVPENEDDVQEEEAVVEEPESFMASSSSSTAAAAPSFAFGGGPPAPASLGGLEATAAAFAPPPPPIAPAPAPPAAGGFFARLLGRSTTVADAPRAQEVRQVRFAAPSSTAQRIRQEMDTNVVSFKCSQLATDVPIHTGDVFLCPTCAVALNSTSVVARRGAAAVWTCEFCQTETVLPLAPEEMPTQSSVDYMLRPAPAVAAHGDETRIIFVVDISGSMCVSVPVEGQHHVRGVHRQRLQEEVRAHGLGSQYLPGERQGVTYISRLQAVQAAVEHQLRTMKQQHPHRRVGLVAFHNEVCIVGDGMGAPVTLAGDTLSNAEALRRAALEFAGITSDIEHTCDALSRKLFALEESSSTALGPALLVAITMAGQVRGSKVVVCTDGLANVGIGSLDAFDTLPEAEQRNVNDLYASLATSAQQAGVVVSVISIIGEECQLERLGRIADATGGEVERVSPLTLMNDFNNILEKPVVATNVSATMFLHKGFYFRNADADPRESKFTVELGTVTADSEAFYEFGLRREFLAKRAAAPAPAASDGAGADGAGAPVAAAMETSAATDAASAEAGTGASAEASAAGASRSAAGAAAAPASGTLPKLQALPFQLQIKFTKLDGSECLRVITNQQPITTSAATAKKEMNVAMFAAHVAQSASKLAEKGDFARSRAISLNAQTMLHRDVMSAGGSAMQRAEASNFFSYMGDLDESTVSSQARMKSATAHGSSRSDEEARRMYKGKKVASKAFAAPKPSPPPPPPPPAPTV